MTIDEIYSKMTDSIDFLDRDLIIGKVIGKNREYVLTHPEKKLSLKKTKKINQMINKRTQGFPLAYLLGEKEFYGQKFLVNRHTLIPRPETELMVEKIISTHPENKVIVDIGTGSGCIIITLQKFLKNRQNSFWATDISPQALRLAKKNARLLGSNKKIAFRSGSLLSPIINNPKITRARKDLLIVANLPYLSNAVWKKTSPNVKKFEPLLALRSGQDGLSDYRKLIKELHSIRHLPLEAYFEFSPEQKVSLEKLIFNVFPKARLKFFRDLSHRYRFVYWKNN